MTCWFGKLRKMVCILYEVRTCYVLRIWLVGHIWGARGSELAFGGYRFLPRWRTLFGNCAGAFCQRVFVLRTKESLIQIMKVLLILFFSVLLRCKCGKWRVFGVRLTILFLSLTRPYMLFFLCYKIYLMNMLNICYPFAGVYGSTVTLNSGRTRLNFVRT